MNPTQHPAPSRLAGTPAPRPVSPQTPEQPRPSWTQLRDQAGKDGAGDR